MRETQKVLNSAYPEADDRLQSSLRAIFRSFTRVARPVSESRCAIETELVGSLADDVDAATSETAVFIQC